MRYRERLQSSLWATISTAVAVISGLLLCSCARRSRESSPSAEDGRSPAKRPIAPPDAGQMSGSVRRQETFARMVGSVDVDVRLGVPYVTPIALIQGSPSPRAVFVCNHGPRLWLGIYNFDLDAIENEREIEAPGRDPLFDDSYFFDRPDFAATKDLDGDGVDDIVGFWMASDGASSNWPRARIVVWSSRTIEELRVEDLFGGPPTPPYVRLRPISGVMGAAVSSFLIVASVSDGDASKPVLSRLKSSVYSYDLATGRQSEAISGLKYLRAPAPLLGSGSDRLCGVTTIFDSNVGEDLMSLRLGAENEPWRVPSRDLPPGEIDFVEPAPDFDSRGVTDLLVIVDDDASSCQLVCIAGEDGAVLWSVQAAASAPIAHSLGDVDGDGAPDIVLVQSVDGRSHDQTSVFILSGATGRSLQDLRILTPSHGADRYVATRLDRVGGWCLLGKARESMCLLRITAQDG
jgi:hypothetical protein